MLSELDLNLKLLRGKPIEVNDICKVHPITLDEIENITITKYYKYINLLCIDNETIKNIMDLNEEITVFEFIYINCKSNKEYRESIFEAFEFFLREEINICDFGFYLGSISNEKNNIRIINEEVFKEIVKIIKLQNCLVDKQEEEKFKPANERARKMLEEMKKNQEELDKAKSKSKDSLNLCDLVSIFAAYSENMNIFNVWDLSFYQFNDQFNRLKIMKEYDANLQVLMHCDTSKNKIELKHWMSNG